MRDSRRNSRHRQVVAAVVGNTLEWYDFIVYGFFSGIIARLFFPAESQYASLLMSLATFGVGFFMRPVGGILLGLYADRKGRKAAMQLIIFLMTLSIALITFAPSYAAIGPAAPVLIVVARLLQGFATGGEYASATAFLVESAPENRRGLYGSWQLIGQCLAVFSGAAMGAWATQSLSEAALHSWGWRVPFALGLLIGPVGLWIRRHMEETEAFLDASKSTVEPPASVSGVLRDNLRGVLVSMGQTITGTAVFYVMLVNMPTFVHKTFGLPLDQVFKVQMAAVALLTVTYPLFTWLAAAPGIGRLLVMQLVICTIIGICYGPAPTTLAEQFATRSRSTGIALAYNVAVMVFGGFAPFIVTWLTHASGSPVAPAWYVLFAASFGLLASVFMHDGAPCVLARRQFQGAPLSVK
ncbi:membrane protein [Burkholderia lata]|uniref:MFS transporter n=1 Tax=Burkholderia lata (strain ATCC 17760 / DSM 23089 / LMG 22485 / NCIMB 9086 / R18194 / 383) TaxID=482957 RepID=UPI001454664E|nr:MFS transporter [Burkholderia lata]VWD62123.1 membrane protein [Burkholderia lata]